MIVKAFNELWPFTLLNTIGNLYFRKWRRRAAHTLLVQLAEHVWPSNIAQRALCELIDLAHFTENIRLPNAGGQFGLYWRRINLMEDDEETAP